LIPICHLLEDGAASVRAQAAAALAAAADRLADAEGADPAIVAVSSAVLVAGISSLTSCS